MYVYNLNKTPEMKKGRSPVLFYAPNLTHQVLELELPTVLEHAVFFQLLTQGTTIQTQDLSCATLIITRALQNAAK